MFLEVEGLISLIGSLSKSTDDLSSPFVELNLAVPGVLGMQYL